MRKFQVNLKITRFDDMVTEDAIREEINIYADANNLFEALIAALFQIDQHLPCSPGRGVFSHLVPINHEEVSPNGKSNIR